jgi:hypothetical protein
VYLYMGLASPGPNLLFGAVLTRTYLQMVVLSMPFRPRYINVRPLRTVLVYRTIVVSPSVSASVRRHGGGGRGQNP